MAILCSTLLMKAALDLLATNVSRICLGDNTAAVSATNAQNTAQNMIAMSAELTGADFTLADSSVTGKKLTIAAQSTLTVERTGVKACYVYLVSTGATGEIYYRTSCATRVFASTFDRVTIPAWDIHFYEGTVL
jgi:hypothetical protein